MGTCSDPETLEGINPCWGAYGGRNLETHSKSLMSLEVARGPVPGTLGSRLPARPHSGPRKKEDPAPASRGLSRGRGQAKSWGKWKANPRPLVLLT